MGEVLLTMRPGQALQGNSHLLVQSLVTESTAHQPQNLSFPLLPSPIQSRVASSLCKLDLPAWYTGKSFSTPTTPRWRRGRSPTSWRRKGGTRSAVITPDNLSLTGHTSPEPGPSPKTPKK